MFTGRLGIMEFAKAKNQQLRGFANQRAQLNRTTLRGVHQRGI